MTKRALVLVDIQNDFLPGGALAVKDGDKILPAINTLLGKPFDLVVATKDWHPHNHGSFATVHHKKTGDIVDLHGLPQILWPPHCIQGTLGSEFGPGWDKSKIEMVFHKGIDKDIDSYSTFYDNGHRRTTGLDDCLKARGIKNIYIAGLTTEYCIKYSVLDAIELGFNVFVVEDGCRGVNLHAGDDARALKEMRKAGATILQSSEV